MNTFEFRPSDKYLIDRIRLIVAAQLNHDPIQGISFDNDPSAYYAWIAGSLSVLAEQAADRIEQLNLGR